MKRTITILLTLSLASLASAQRPLRHVLFDFEDGIEAWTTNVWGGGGTVTLSPAAESKFGTGALHSEIVKVERGGNTIAPHFDEPGAWREHEWGQISFWFRGDGTPARASFRLFTGAGEEGGQGYSLNVPMDSTEWRHITAPMSAFWNRERVPMDTHNITWLYIGAGGTHSFEIDQIALEAPQRPVALRPVEGDVPVEPQAAQFGDGRYGLRFDPTPLGKDGATVSARFELPDGAHEVTQELPAGPPQDEVFLVAPASVESGVARVTLTIARGGQAQNATWEFDTVAGRPAPEPTVLSLLPAPKEITLGEGAWTPPDRLPFRVTEPESRPVLMLLMREMAAMATTLQPDVVPRAPGQPLSLDVGEGCAAPPEAVARLTDLPAGGYVLSVGDAGVSIRAISTEGLRNGALTLLQAIESHWALTGELAVPAMQVVDWPNLPIRAVSIPLPNGRWGFPNDTPADPDTFLRFMREIVLKTKLNLAVIIIHQAMQYESHPEVAGPAAWSKADVKRVFDTLRSWGVEPVPHMNSLGHANWLTIPLRNLGIAEDDDVHQLCTSNPESKRVMLDLYQEIIDLVQPKYFHVGLDEIRWNTENLPPEQRCALCRGLNKQDVFVDWVTMLHGFLSGQGIEMMMWGDMILPGHNGGPPYNLAEAVDRLPKDVIIADWSTRVMPDSHQWLLDHGYTRIIQSNSTGTNLAQQRLVSGNMVGIWGKLPWLTEHVDAVLELNSYEAIIEGAEYSWNFWPDLFEALPPLSAEFFAQRPLAQWRIGAQPIPGPITPIGLPMPAEIEGLPAGPVRFGHLSFEVNGGLAPEPGEEIVLPIGRKARALYLLHAARLLDVTAMSETFKDQANWRGTPIAQYVVTYASGATETIPVRYGMEVRDPQEGRCVAPVAYNSLGVAPMTCASDSLHFYALQWRNPAPFDPIASLTMRGLDAPARAILAGLQAQ